MTKSQCILILLVICIPMFTWDAFADATPTDSCNSDNIEIRDCDLALLRFTATNTIIEVQRLLKQGAAANAIMQDRNKRSALILAAAGGHKDVVEALINSGADIEYQDNAGLTALNWSVMRKRNKVTEYLLSVHANVNTSDNRGITPVMFAVGTRNTKTLQMLKANGAKLDVKSKASKMTPLLIAIENGDHDITLTLLKLGANINSANHDGHTPLMSAAESGHVKMLKTLIAHGADTKAKNLKGMTALTLAQQNGQNKIEEILIAAYR